MGVIIPAVRPTSWAEASIISRPAKRGDKPIVLVRRRHSDLQGPNGEELVYMPAHPAISLFTGAGGFDIGLEQAGFISMCQHEWDATCCETLLGNRPNLFRHSALIQGDLRQTPTSMILKEAGLEVGETYVIVGGPPCQGFSIANSNRGKSKDERNDLIFEFLRVISEAKPKTFIMENVPGFVSFNKHEYLKAFLKAAYGAYYDLVYGLVNAVEYGVPQYRCRFICMGTRRDLSEGKGMLGSLPSPRCFGNSDLPTIRGIEGSPLFIAQHRNLTRAPGIRYFPDRPVLIPPDPIGNDGGRSKTFLEFYRRIEELEPDRLVFQPKNEAA